jgi:signal transduction histidine kinase
MVLPVRIGRSTYALAAGFVIVIAIIAAVVVLSVRLQDAAIALRRNFVVVTALDDIYSTMQDAETGQRGFLLTGSEPYLAPYDKAVADVGKGLKDLKAALAHDAYLVGRLPNLVGEVQAKLDELQRTIGLYRGGDKTAALGIVASDGGRVAMDRLRTILGDMRTHAQTSLQDAFAIRDRIAVQLQLAVVIGLVGLILVSVVAVRGARRNSDALVRQAALVADRNRELEETNTLLRHEIETRQSAEAQLRQLQKMEAIGQLTGGIAHDFNNVLAVVLSAVGLIRRRIAAGDYDIGRFIDGAAEAAERAASLTARLLAFSRQQALQPEPLDVNKLVAGMSELLRRTLGEMVQLETVLAGGLWHVHVDARQLENSIINLAVNSRDAMADGGRITIETGNAHLDDTYVRDNPGTTPGQYVLVAVTDTGSGMSPEVAARAFDPFFTTKEIGRGTGLGLSQVYGFIKQSDGHLKIYSEVGTGTTVKLYLQRYLGTEPERARSAGDEQQPLQGGAAEEVILVAEDDDRVRAMVVESLSQIGYTVLAAADGPAALKVVDGRDDIILLFTDVVMPGMTGRKLAEEAQVRRPGLKVLYTTGFTRNAVVHNGVLDPGVMFLQKPFTLERLAAKVRSVIDG